MSANKSALLPCIAVIAVVALSNSASAYTLRQTPAGHQVRWNAHRIVLRLDRRLERKFGREQVRRAAVIASEAWRGFEGVPEIVIAEGPARPFEREHRGQAIYLLDPWPYEHQQLARAITSFRSDGTVVGADVVINGEHPFALLDEGEEPAGTVHDLAAVLTHEFGHVLGLGENWDDETATMNPYIRPGDVHQRTLEPDDEDGVIAAYAEALPPPAVCAVASPGRHQQDSYGAFGALLVIASGVLGRRRRRSRLRTLGRLTG